MKILKVKERSSVEIPLAEILGSDGQLNLRSDLIGRGLVEVKQSKRNLRLQVNGLVGRLPLNSQVGLDISPKFPIINLNRMVYTSKVQFSNLFQMERPYEDLDADEYLPVPLIRSYAQSLKNAIDSGLLKKYRRAEFEGSPRPRVNFNKTQQKYWAKLRPTTAVMERFEFDQDNLPNQFLKLAATKSLAISRSSPHLQECIKVLSSCLRDLSAVTTRDVRSLRADVAAVRRVVPSWRREYVKAVQHSIKIINALDVSLDATSEGLLLESFIISLDDVFEGYVRSVLAELPSFGFGRVATVDGNLHRHQRPLFLDNPQYKTKPDLIVKDARGILLIGDAKYKKKPSEEDRYQIITHALAYGVRKAVLVYPKPQPNTPTGLRRLGIVGSVSQVEVFEYYIDLGGDMAEGELELRQAFFELSKDGVIQVA